MKKIFERDRPMLEYALKAEKFQNEVITPLAAFLNHFPLAREVEFEWTDRYKLKVESWKDYEPVMKGLEHLLKEQPAVK
jgi:hypothetical protein